MFELTRTVRFFLNDGPDADPPAANAHSAWPPARGLARYYEMDVSCGGAVDAVTGYMVNIREIDRAVREGAIACLRAALAGHDSSAAVPMGRLLQDLLASVQAALALPVRRVALALSPCHRLAIGSDDLSNVMIAQRFSFAAAHRLHVAALSDEQNRAVFGKCNHVSGHGHNYEVEVVVAAPVDPQGAVARVETLDEKVHAVVIRDFDHKHLNVDLPEFRDRNPSVENIARAIYDRLEPALGEVALTLQEVSVWETPKTRCTCRRPSAAAAPPHTA